MATTKKVSHKAHKHKALPEDVLEAWKKVQQDSNPINWIMIEFKTPKSKKVVLVNSGAGGLPHVLPLLDDSKVQMVGFRVSAVDKSKPRELAAGNEKGKAEDAQGVTRGAAISVRPHFYKLSWFGSKVS